MQVNEIKYSAGLRTKRVNAATIAFNLFVLPLMVFAMILLLMPILAPYSNSDVGDGSLSILRIISIFCNIVVTVGLIASAFYVCRKVVLDTANRSWIEPYNKLNDPITEIMDLHKRKEISRSAATKGITDIISGWETEESIVGIFHCKQKSEVYDKIANFVAVFILLILCTTITMCDHQRRVPGFLGTNSVSEIWHSFLLAMQAGLPIMLMMHFISGWTERVLPNELPLSEVERISERMLDNHMRGKMTKSDAESAMFQLHLFVKRNSEKSLKSFFQAPMWRGS